MTMALSWNSPKTRQYLGFALMLLVLLVVTPGAYMLFNQEEVFWRRGQQAYAAGDYTKASESYARALERGKTDYVLLDRLGESYMATDRPGRALKVFQQLRQKRPEDPLVLTRMARAYWSADYSARALEVVNRSLELKQGNRSALFLRARILTSLGRYEEAIDIYYRILGEKR